MLNIEYKNDFLRKIRKIKNAALKEQIKKQAEVTRLYSTL